MAKSGQDTIGFQEDSHTALIDSINQWHRRGENSHPSIEYKIQHISHSTVFDGSKVIYSAIVVFEYV